MHHLFTLDTPSADSRVTCLLDTFPEGANRLSLLPVIMMSSVACRQAAVASAACARLASMATLAGRPDRGQGRRATAGAAGAAAISRAHASTYASPTPTTLGRIDTLIRGQGPPTRTATPVPVPLPPPPPLPCPCLPFRRRYPCT